MGKGISLFSCFIIFIELYVFPTSLTSSLLLFHPSPWEGALFTVIFMYMEDKGKY